MTMTDTSLTDALQLEVHHEPGGQVDSVTRIDWCITKQARDQLISEEFVDPMLLLVVTHDKVETDRYVVPISAGRWHVRFRHPGLNTVYAAVVSRGPHEDVDLAKKLTKQHKSGSFVEEVMRVSDRRLDKVNQQIANASRDYGGFRDRLYHEQRKGSSRTPPVLPDDPTEQQTREHEIQLRIYELQTELDAVQGIEGPDADKVEELQSAMTAAQAEIDRLTAEQLDYYDNPQMEMYFSWGHFKRSSFSAELDVVVPQDMFAKEPPRWMTWLGNKWDWPHPPRDQCQLRRRALATLPMGIFFILLGIFVWLANALTYGFLLFMGKRSLNTSALDLRKGLAFPVDVWEDMEPSVWTHKQNKEGYPRYKRRISVFWFLNPPVLLLTALVGYVLYRLTDLRFWLILGLTLGVGFALIAAVVELVAAGPIRRHRAQASKRERQGLERQRRLAEQRLSTAVCGVTQPRRFNPLSLPRERKVSYLMQAGKALVCKPFAG